MLQNDTIEKYYCLVEHTGLQYQHGGVGITDAEKIIMGLGIQLIRFPNEESHGIMAKWNRLKYLINQFFKLPKGAVVIFPFPMFASLSRWMLHLLRFRKSIKLVCFIHDIDGLRDCDSKLLSEELNFLKRYHYFIVHNESMEDWIKANVGDCFCGKLFLFDYLAEPSQTVHEKKNEIIFAGNLSKSGFLQKWDVLPINQQTWQFHIYGQGDLADFSSKKNTNYKGVYDPHQLPALIEGSFGLVWDGNEVETCAGKFGDYLRYNSPHKVSLYMMSGLPIIVWEKAAIAKFVLKEKIGFTIGSLYEIKDKLDALTEDEYNVMRENTKPIARKLSKGGFLQSAVDLLMEEMEG